VERGVNPKDFSKVGEVAAKNIAQGAAYLFTDANAPKGKVFYRLKMVDIDGTFEYSNVALVNNKGVLALDVFPNPAFNKINVQVPAHENAVSVSIIGADGRMFKNITLNAEENRKEISIQELPAGSYFVIYNDGSQRLNARFNKQ
jgi:Secretion system C-terminal sorting domain